MSKIFYVFPLLVFVVFTIIIVGTNNHSNYNTIKVNKTITTVAKKQIRMN